jgi:protein-tyrosine phosphatase
MNPAHLGEFQPRFWVGDLQSLKDLSKIKTHWTVISILHSEKLFYAARIVLSQMPDCIENHTEWHLPDTYQADFLSDRLREIMNMMDQIAKDDQKSCLVHCAQGCSRSAATCAAWLITRNPEMSLRSALETIRLARPQIRPNCGLIATLRALEQTKSVEDAMKRMHSKKV